MDKNFYMGILLGLVGGAVASANSMKLRRAVKDGQEQIMSAINGKMGENSKSKGQSSEQKQ